MTDQNKQNKRNLLYFESPTMHGLYECMEKWQEKNSKRFLSISVQLDGGKFCCLALTNPTEVVIVDRSGKRAVNLSAVDVSGGGALLVKNSP
jgi:hypothetical protein